MVFPDLSAPQSSVFKHHQSSIPIAPVIDRLIAFVLDFLIFSPVISLFIAGITRQARTHFILEAFSPEGAIALILICIAIFFLSVLLQAVFLYFWQATPGQVFLQLRVISYPHRHAQLSLNQCLLRSFLWFFGLIPLAFPYLEILSHPLRRAFHERASDTMVVTLKREYDDGPFPVESQFVSSWMRMGFLFVCFLAVVSFFKTYHKLLVGHYKDEAEASSLHCKELKDLEHEGVSRIDLGIGIFLLDGISPECLEKETQASFWGSPLENQELAYLAKFFLSEGKQQEEYLSKICQQEKSEACVLAKFSLNSGDIEFLESTKPKLWASKVLLSEERYARQEYQKSLQYLEEIQESTALKRHAEKKFVRTIWSLNEIEKKSEGRTPASSQTDKFIKKFKEQYEIP